MAHRGRLNMLVNVVKKPFTAGLLASSRASSANPDDVQGSGDVKYHLGTSTDIEIAGRTIHLSLQPNPSHLEAVDPVVVGKVRARQDMAGDTKGRHSVMGILLHGDAAFAGQGLVYETLAMSQLIGYRTGGRCISSSTTRSASPPSRRTPIPASTAPTSPSRCRRRSCT